MPIIYDKKKKKWELKIKEGDKEELAAVIEVGKKVIVGELTREFTQATYSRWLEMPEQMIWGPQ